MAKQPSVGEHRGAPRYAVRARVVVQPITGGPTGAPDQADGRPEKVWMRDLSSGGVGFMHTKAMRKGQLLLVYVPELEDLSPLRCAVVRCERSAGDVFVIGASFTAVPGTQTAAPVLESLPSATVTRVTAHVAARAGSGDAPDAAAALSEKAKRAATDSATPTALLTLDGRLSWSNAAFGRMLGFDPAELVGRAFTSLAHPSDDWSGANPAQPAAGVAKSRGDRRRFARRDGSAVGADLSANPLRDVAGRPLFVLAVAQPVRDADQPAVVARAPAQATPALPKPSAADDEVDRIRRAMFD